MLKIWNQRENEKITIYIDVIIYILKIHFFLLFAGYDRTTKVRNLLV